MKNTINIVSLQQDQQQQDDRLGRTDYVIVS